MKLAARESEEWAERGLLERSERGGESYIRLQRNSLARSFSSADERRCGTNTGRTKAVEEIQAGSADKSGEEDKGS